MSKFAFPLNRKNAYAIQTSQQSCYSRLPFYPVFIGGLQQKASGSLTHHGPAHLSFGLVLHP
jgi:hypothetical protein